MLQRLRAMGAEAAGARFSAGRPPSGEPPPEEGERGDLGPPPPVFREVGARGEAAEPPPYEVGREVPRGPRRWWLRLLVVAAVLLVLFVIANIAIGIYVDRLWFDELGYRGVFNTRIGAKIWLFLRRVRDRVSIHSGEYGAGLAAAAGDGDGGGESVPDDRAGAGAAGGGDRGGADRAVPGDHFRGGGVGAVGADPAVHEGGSVRGAGRGVRAGCGLLRGSSWRRCSSSRVGRWG